MRKNDKFVGEVFNDWTVVGIDDSGAEIKWLCRCKCGEEKVQKVYNIKCGKSKRCKKCDGRSRRKV